MERDWLIDDCLPAGEVVMFAGHGGTGKSTIMFQLCAAVASGSSEWLPASPRCSVIGGGAGVPVLNPDAFGVALMASWEDDVSEAQRRMSWIGKDVISGVEDRFVFFKEASKNTLWSGDSDSGGQPTGRLLRLTEQALQLEAQLLVIDPSAAAYGSDENNRKAVREFLSWLSDFAKRTQITIVVVSHPSKQADVVYSGSTDWWNAPRALWSLRWVEFRVDEDGRPMPPRATKGNLARGLRLRWEKSNYGKSYPMLADVWLRREDGRYQVCTQAEAATLL